MNPQVRVVLSRTLIPCLGAALLVACTEEQPLCEERTKRCLNIETRDVEIGGRTHFQVRLANTCQEEIEYKLCFEVPDATANCRQNTLAPARRAEETIPLDRFGEKTRVFVRYVRDAKACRFPLTPDVKF